MNRKIRMVNDQMHTIPFLNEQISNHFEDTRNCTREILHQTNQEGIYDNYIDVNDKVVLDIGANIGLFAIHVSPYPEKIYCVEPTPSHVQILRDITKDFSNIEVIEAALSNESGFVDFYSLDKNTTMNSLIDRGSIPFKVKSYSLPDLMNELGLDKVDFCKIDIEGSEVIALNDEIISSVSNRIKKFFIEFHWANGSNYDIHREHYSNIFKKYGYFVDNFSVDGIYCYKEI
jgi:FkbM family methyltransferase